MRWRGTGACSRFQSSASELCFKCNRDLNCNFSVLLCLLGDGLDAVNPKDWCKGSYNFRISKVICFTRPPFFLRTSLLVLGGETFPGWGIAASLCDPLQRGVDHG